MAYPSTPGIVTPEAVLLEFRPAGVATRIVARAVDALIQGLLVLLVVLGLAAASAQSAAPLLVALFVVVLVLPIATEVLWSGRSPGKALFGLRVVSADGAPVRPLQSIVRGVLQIVDVYTSFIGLFPMLVTRRSQRFGDLLAGTFVLAERIGTADASPIAFLPPPGTEQWVYSADVARLRAEHYGVIRAFLLRVTELDPGARTSLAVALADRAHAMVTPEPWPWFSAELYLNCIASAYQLRNGGFPPAAPPVGYGPPPGWPATP